MRFIAPDAQHQEQEISELFKTKIEKHNSRIMISYWSIRCDSGYLITLWWWQN
ncbi:hypothetical protein O9929_03455 [Vibrio lentus]|nr:hypothetical protein [Vibrio lentus]